MNSKELSRVVAQLALEKKARDITILDLKNLSDVTDFFVICTGDTDVHVKAIADHIDDMAKTREARVWRKEGYRNLQWILLDFVDVVVHVFQPKVREYYNLERFWGDAETVHIDDHTGEAAT